MRRKDREMSREYGLEVIDRAEYAVLAIADAKADLPYAIPLSIARQGETLYFHSAKAGSKVDLFRENRAVRIVFVDQAKVPNLYSKEEVERLMADQGADFVTSKIFTTEFSSAIVSGSLRPLEADKDPESEYVKALRTICLKYVPAMMDYFEIALATAYNTTNVYAVDIKELTAKRKKFADNKEEIKWQK